MNLFYFSTTHTRHEYETQILQEQELDRPAGYALVLQGADPFKYAGLQKENPAVGRKKNKKAGVDSAPTGASASGQTGAPGVTAVSAPEKRESRTPTRISMKDKGRT